MMHRIIRNTICILATLLLIGCGDNEYKNLTENKYKNLRYNLCSYGNRKNEQAYLFFEVTITGYFIKDMIMNLPSGWAGENYLDQIKNIETPNHDHVILSSDDNQKNNQIKIKISEPTESIRLRYQIHQRKDNPLNVHSAIIQDSLMHSPGYGILATPDELDDSQKLFISIRWMSSNEHFNTMSSHSSRPYFSKEDGSISDFLHGFYISGKTRLHLINNYVAGSMGYSHCNLRPVFLSLYGLFDVPDEQFIADLKSIINNQRLFFNDYNFPYGAISIIRKDDSRSMEGTRLNNSFLVNLPYDVTREEYYNLFSHENLHNWFGGKIRKSEKERLEYWWSEGFTEYYSRVINLRSDDEFIDISKFVKEANRFLRNYYLSPVLNEPNSRIDKDFWNNRDIEKLPYNRGFVFAIYLNNIIKQNNSEYSLDNVIFDLFKKAKKENQHFSSELFAELTKKYAGRDISSDIEEYINQGKTIKLDNVNLPIKKELIGKYYLGFDKDSTMRYKIITNLDVKSNAYKVGLREGDEILAYDITGGNDPNVIIRIKTKDNTFEFKPEHYNKVEVYQLDEELTKENLKKFKAFFDAIF